MLSIGEFARHAGVSVRMLRHYDARGLLVPAQVDPVTGYRSYAASQLPRVNRLVALKGLGFTLEQVGPVLDAQVTVEELRGMLLLRSAQIADQIEADRERLQRIERRLRTIEKEGAMSDLEYFEKSLPALRLAQLVARVDSQSEIGPQIGPMFQRLDRELPRAGVSIDQPGVAWYDSLGEEGMQIAAAYPTVLKSVPVEGVEVADLPAVSRAVSVVHHGHVATIGDTWQALMRHLEDAGLAPAGPGREVYLESPLDDWDRWVTELQQPVT